MITCLYRTSIRFVDMSRNNQLDVENKRLTMKVEEMKQICTHSSSLNLKYVLELDQESTQKEILQEANHKLKLKLNVLSIKCNEFQDKIKVLETNLMRRPATRLSQPVRIISSVSDIVVGNQVSDKALSDLQKKFNELDVQHQEALNMIDDLEFELGDVPELSETFILNYFNQSCFIFHAFLQTSD